MNTPACREIESHDRSWKGIPPSALKSMIMTLASTACPLIFLASGGRRVIQESLRKKDKKDSQDGVLFLPFLPSQKAMDGCKKRNSSKTNDDSSEGGMIPQKVLAAMQAEPNRGPPTLTSIMSRSMPSGRRLA